MSSAVCQKAVLWWSSVDPRWTDRAYALPSDELCHLESIRDESAHRSQACSYVMRREVIGHVMGIQPSEVVITRWCAACGSTEHGRPGVVGLEHYGMRSISISHCDAVVGLAMAPSAVGLDIERDRPSRAWSEIDALTRHWRDGAESPLHLWTGKEAALKMLGVGLGVPMKAMCLHGSRWHLNTRDASVGRAAAGTVQWPLLCHNNVLGALATPRATRVTVRQWAFS